MNKKKNLPKRYFQYIDGENKGKVVTLTGIEDFDGEMMYEFDDGESMFAAYVAPMTTNKKALDKKFMVEVKSPAEKYLWRFDTVKETRVDLGNMESQMAPPIEDIINADMSRDETGNFALKESALGKTKILFPRDMSYDPIPLPDINWMYDDGNSEQVATNETQVQQAADTSPVQQTAPVRSNIPPAPAPDPMTDDERAISVLVGRSKKIDTDVEITITLGLPAKALYGIAESNFDNGGDLFIKEIVKSLTHEMIVKALADGLKVAYSSSDDEHE